MISIMISIIDKTINLAFILLNIKESSYVLKNKSLNSGEDCIIFNHMLK